MMPEQNKPNDPARGEAPPKSVIETDHPVFSKLRKELPNFQQKMESGHPVFLNLKKWNREYLIFRYFCVFLCCFALSFFIYKQIADPFLDYKLGDIAQRHLIAQRTMEMEDYETTTAKRKAASEGVLAVYDYDRRMFFQTTDKIRRAFSQLRKNHGELVDLSIDPKVSSFELELTDAFVNAKRVFSEELGIDVSDSQFEMVVRLKYSRRLERALTHLLSKANLSLILANKEQFGVDSAKGITLNKIGDAIEGNSTEQVFTNIGSILDLDHARDEMDSEIKQYLDSTLTPYSDRILSLAKKMVRQNLTMNLQETERRKMEVQNDVKGVLFKINKGESIVKYGETINEHHLAILKMLQRASQNNNFRLQFFFTTIFLFIIIWSLMNFLSGGMPKFQYNPKDLLAIFVLMVTTILSIKSIQYLAAEALVEKFPQIPFDFYYFLVPVAVGPVIIRMLMDKEPAITYAVCMSIVGGVLLDRNFFYAAYILASSLTAAAFANKIKTRAVIYRAGLITGTINTIMIICIVANTRNGASLEMIWQDTTWILWCGVLSGFFLSMIVVSIVPLIEAMTGRTSDLRLLELANMNHPLLRDLMVKAPGTYHHSMVIGSLVEAAAESIGANPLLARVMSYYHDVGKMERPAYFIENQAGGYNRHDALQPHMSAMIIRDHVKKGQELGYKHKLPQSLIDAMSEHHGSSTIWYFYNKARSQAEDPNSVLESEYKYDGMKPQSKETALVMLGDVVEAATRSVADPSPQRLSGVVKGILNKYFAEGQLSECDLTLRDLDSIAKSFLEVLLGIYHSRIEYGVPSLRESGRKKHGSADPKNPTRATGPSLASAANDGSSPPKAYQVPSASGGSSKKG